MLQKSGLVETWKGFADYGRYYNALTIYIGFRHWEPLYLRRPSIMLDKPYKKGQFVIVEPNQWPTNQYIQPNPLRCVYRRSYI